MEIKKNPKKDLELRKSLFFQIGLVFSLLVVLIAFEWKTYDKVDESIFDMVNIVIPEEEIEITRPEDKPEPPPAPQAPEIEIVEDDEEVEDVLTFDDVEEYVHVEYDIERVEEEEIVEAEIFTIVEEQPDFVGGYEAMMKYIQANVVYPKMANESGIQGTVFVTFVVEPDGSVTNVKVLRGIGGGCDEEAIRVVKSMPKWKAGKQRGKPVRVQFNLPIRFRLQ